MKLKKEGDTSLRTKLKLAIASLLLCMLIFTGVGCGKAAQNTAQSDQIIAIEYDSAIVGYLGPEGTYSQEVCGVFFQKKGTYIPYETVAEAVEALKAGECTYAVIPQENTIGGAVIDYLDIVIANEELSVVGEVELPINQNLLALPGTDLGSIKKVYSHKQGIAQGKEWLAANLPQAEIIEVSSTSEGARIVADEGDATQAAIASAACADVYGLEILASSIQNNDSNKTRFYVLSTEEPSHGMSERCAFILTGKASDLPSIMAGLENKGIELVTIHERPEKTELGNYVYIIECANCNYEQISALVEDVPFGFRYLGSFEVD
jgi:prephenate dehydratase